MELRRDYILDRWVIIAEGRGKRPVELAEESGKKKGKCFFCPGNEQLTPEEIGRVAEGKGWKFRWFPNKFPAVEAQGNREIRTDNSFFTFSDAYGVHEVIVETPSATKQLWDLSASDLKGLFGIYRDRIAELSKKDGISYVSVFKNHGMKGGASLQHSHTQAIATSLLPPVILQEAEASKKKGSCTYCRVIDIEKGSFRRCFENSGAVAFTPYASRFSYELWIFPKRHVRSLDDFSDAEMSEFSGLLHAALVRLKSLNVSYNYFIHYSPGSEDLHFHVELTPRIATWAGFELSSGVIINTTTPEDAAKFYRGEAEF